MDSSVIAAVFTGLSGLVVALAGLLANRSRRIAAEQRALRRRVRTLERQILALVEHTFTLELEIARHGGRVPDRPLILEQMNADADDEDAPAPPQPTSGRHSLREN